MMPMTEGHETEIHVLIDSPILGGLKMLDSDVMRLEPGAFAQALADAWLISLDTIDMVSAGIMWWSDDSDMPELGGPYMIFPNIGNFMMAKTTIDREMLNPKFHNRGLKAQIEFKIYTKSGIIPSPGAAAAEEDAEMEDSTEPETAEE